VMGLVIVYGMMSWCTVHMTWCDILQPAIL
jgi:hypothetical protein